MGKTEEVDAVLEMGYVWVGGNGLGLAHIVAEDFEEYHERAICGVDVFSPRNGKAARAHRCSVCREIHERWTKE